ncbi:metalloendopeptidase, partial [Trichonephila clavata]
AVFVNHHFHAQPLRRQRIRRNAYRNESRLWPKAVVPYTIDDAYSGYERIVIERAMKDIQSISCIRFKKQSTEKAFVEIVRGKGCRAVVDTSVASPNSLWDTVVSGWQGFCTSCCTFLVFSMSTLARIGMNMLPYSTII